ncbi:MAG: hypothetical protein KKD39_01865 [Candidatus Altiarchaeota archaeon]|nr:hypothetical protein [Candidatus Altiarchaeota archaeon]
MKKILVYASLLLLMLNAYSLDVQVYSPNSLFLDFGNDTTNEWSHNLYLTGSELINATSYINQYVRGGCWCLGCQSDPASGTCCVPVIFTSVVKGNLTVNSGNLTYRRTEVLGAVGYGNSFRTNHGACWKIAHLGGETPILPLPRTHSGGVCLAEDYFYSDSFDPSQVVNTPDASIDAVYRLLNGTLDSDRDGIIDIYYNAENMTFKSSAELGIQSMWGPTKMRLVVWS